MQESGLSVIQERVPPGAGEILHFHTRSRQFFFVLSGRATIEIEFDDAAVSSGPVEAIHVPPLMRHRFVNAGTADVVFLVISPPATRGDRTELGQSALQTRR